MNGRPIRPDEVVAAKTRYLPPEVFDAFNELITKRFDGRRALIKQGEALEEVCRRLGIEPAEALSRKLLDVEQSYRAEGWTVSYDSPAYNEDYEASFDFRPGTRP